MKKKVLAALCAGAMLCGMEHYLTEDQIELADILPDTFTEVVTDTQTGTTQERVSRITARDTIMLLKYYTYAMVDEELKEKDIVDWIKEDNPQLWAKYEK